MRKMLGATALLVSLAVPAAAHAALTQLTDLFVFGDSLSDGGNSGLASQAAFGVTFPPAPYYNGQYSNGPVAVEYLWQSFNPGNPKFKPSLSQGGDPGTNYAIGGATTGSTSFNGVNSSVPDILKPVYAPLSNTWQLQTFAGQPKSFDPATSLFVVWLFPNDVFYQATTGKLPGTFAGGLPTDSVDPGALIANGVNNIVGTINFLALNGAQHFLVPNMGDLGLTPAFNPSPQLSGLTAAFNQTLKGALTQLDASLPAVDIVQFDNATLFADLVNNPQTYGFDNATDGCLANLLNGQCNPDKWVFWDDVHPTTKAHEVLAQQFRAAVVPEPQSYALMALGLVVVGWSARRRKLPA